MAPSASPYAKGPVTTIDEVLERQHEIADYLARQPAGTGDGIWIFNDLYITITEQVKQGCDKSDYEDNEFMKALDVAFANRYFDALRDDARHQGSAPEPWQVLIGCRTRKHIEALQFAAAGVNAHINFDLAAAVFKTWHELGHGQGAAQHKTYQAIDGVFAKEMDPLRKKFELNWQREVDEGPISKFLDLLGDLLVDGTRDLAWHHAKTLWKWRRVPLADHMTMDWLSLTAHAAGEALLLPLR